MNNFVKALLFGIVEGITEWLPISSTGHMLLLNQWFPLNVSSQFFDLFLVVIQFGAVFAVIFVYRNEFCPKNMFQNYSLWLNTFIALIPAVAAALFLDDYIEETFYNPHTVAITLIVYGIIFILLEIRNKNKLFKISDIHQLSYRHGFYIGCFQLLALIPGTSRSGATIIGAMLLGISREVAAKFTFYLAIPVMLGASIFKIGNYGWPNQKETALLCVGMAVSCLVSFFVIHLFLNFVKKHSFVSFGIYRILLGCILLLFM